MKISKNLLERIEQLEVEQEQQQQELKHLEKLTDLSSINDLEQELLKLSDNEKSTKQQNSKNVDKSIEITLNNKNKSIKSSDKKKPTNIDLSKERLNKEKGKGYVVCLMFNQNFPSEWSDEGAGGWRSSGQGTCYLTKKLVNHKFTELKSRWSDYPLEIRQLKL
jgi:hypothetical protein